MLIFKKYEELKPLIEDGELNLAGDVEFHFDLEDRDLEINSAKSLWFKYGCSVLHLSAGKDIWANDGISANNRISAGRGIYAKQTISGLFVSSQTFDIKCEKLITSQLPFWRNFWAKQLPLKKWQNQILNDKNCWNDLKSIPTQQEKQEICAWEGWHPILKAQLEMFFGLKTEVLGSELQ